MRLTFLGTGTSQGVPLIGCQCNVCTSDDPRNRRMRPSVWLQINPPQGDDNNGDQRHIVIDTPAEFRLQAIKHGLSRLDALLYTHAHADHIFGIDDIRRFNQMQREIIPLYASKQTLSGLEQIASYIFNHSNKSWALPKADPIIIDGPFDLFGTPVEPLLVLHGKMPVTAFRIGRFAYVTDCSEIPVATMKRLEGLDLLVLDALRYTPHPTHFSIPQALDIVEKLQPKQTLLTHLSHEVDHAQTVRELPEGVSLAYDGLVVELSP